MRPEVKLVREKCLLGRFVKKPGPGGWRAAARRDLYNVPNWLRACKIIRIYSMLRGLA
mgnify:CR=1 FL=1